MQTIVVVTLVLLASCTGCTASGEAREQFAAVKGLLLCGAKPASDVLVRLYDIDAGADPHDLLDQETTDINGVFELKGSTTEETTIEPVLRIYHSCDEPKTAIGLRKVSFHIPSQYVTAVGASVKYFDIGQLNLETRFSDEEREILADKKRRRHHPHRYNRLATYDNEMPFFEDNDNL